MCAQRKTVFFVLPTWLWYQSSSEQVARVEHLVVVLQRSAFISELCALKLLLLIPVMRMLMRTVRGQQIKYTVTASTPPAAIEYKYHYAFKHWRLAK